MKFPYSDHLINAHVCKMLYLNIFTRLYTCMRSPMLMRTQISLRHFTRECYNNLEIH